MKNVPVKRYYKTALRLLRDVGTRTIFESVSQFSVVVVSSVKGSEKSKSNIEHAISSKQVIYHYLDIALSLTTKRIHDSRSEGNLHLFFSLVAPSKLSELVRINRKKSFLLKEIFKIFNFSVPAASYCLRKKKENCE